MTASLTTGILPLFLLLGSHVAQVSAWGSVGHQAVGYVAMPFLAPNALSFVRSTLGSQYSQSLGPAAPWADTIRSDDSYDWASNLHFVDAEDSPPSSCSVVQSRDCADGRCILTAIANYTSRVVDTSLSATQTQEALKFLDHFIGDIHQPLHVEAEALGGNEIDVTCSGTSTNLHSVRYTRIIAKLVDDDYGNSVTTWANSLADRIQSGDFADDASSWIECSSTTDPARRKRSVKDDVVGFLHPRAITPLECPLEWAQDANKLDCSFVFTYDQFDDLCTSSYYDDAVPLIEMQIAKAGYRLAAWLNVLFDGDTEL
ncbi:nuclease Le1 [Dendrothele bispora CBS 962.96]|uniref:Nuclease Le1 n=1 Tax=Dendrothele bispora (strain CBS 962.96) TaxID=1314807 RepID=A0A4S8LK07_DENBC|nr:nuclease Le1 [Dendrothele bispora CBS 962.96]